MYNVAENENLGGVYHAIVGSIEQSILALLFSIPIAYLYALYFTEYCTNKRLKYISNILIDILSSTPSIVVALFVVAVVFLTFNQHFAGVWGSVALTVIVLPITIKNYQSVFQDIPKTTKEAAYALGALRIDVIRYIVCPISINQIINASFISFTRIIGETAPALLLIFGNPAINNNPFSGAQESLTLFIFHEAQQPYPIANIRAWSAALILIFIIIILRVLMKCIRLLIIYCKKIYFLYTKK